jgi:magnesium-transporting ATPase (P-type)
VARWTSTAPPAHTHGSARRGLTAAEAAERLRGHGPNALPQADPLAVWRRALRQFRSPLIYVLLPTGVAVTWAGAEAAGRWAEPESALRRTGRGA